jgi:hypothetical protein
MSIANFQTITTLILPHQKACRVQQYDASKFYAAKSREISCVQPKLGVGGLNFIMARQAAIFHKPDEGQFGDPAFAQHFEATLVLEAIQSRDA